MADEWANASLPKKNEDSYLFLRVVDYSYLCVRKNVDGFDMSTQW